MKQKINLKVVVVRSGSWCGFSPGELFATFGFKCIPTAPVNDLGFRLVRST